MSTRIDYAQIAAKLDYTALDKKLSQLAEREPPKKRRTAEDLLEPLREKLLALYRKGWSSAQLVEELKAAGVPVNAKEPAAGKALIAYLTSPAARPVVEAAGMEFVEKK